MPTYEFVCEKCHLHGELTQSIKDALPGKCPECGAKPDDWHQVYDGDVFCYCNPGVTTVGKQAEVNAKRWGKEQMQVMAEKENREVRERRSQLPNTSPGYAGVEPVTPWWRHGSPKPLNLSKIADPKKYVLTGKKT